MSSDTSLDGTLPQLQQAVAKLEQLAAGRGISVELNRFGGYRDAATTQQILYYRQADYDAALESGEIPPSETIDQFRPIAEFGTSFHNYGAAADLSPLAWPASESYAWAVQQLGQLAPAAGLRQPLPATDPAHFELPVSLDQAQQLYAQFIGAPALAGTAGGWPGVVALGVLAGLFYAAFGRRRPAGGSDDAHSAG